MVKCEYCGKEIGLLAVRYTWIDKENNIAVHDKCLEEYKRKNPEKIKQTYEEKQIQKRDTIPLEKTDVKQPSYTESEVNKKEKKSDLYLFEMLFLLRIDELKNANKKEVKQMNKRINKFKENTKSLLESHAVPMLGKLPIPGTQMVGYAETNLSFSLMISENEDLQAKCMDSNIQPILLSNRYLPCSYKSFPTNIQENIDKIKNGIQRYANKYSLDGEYYATLYAVERDYKGIIEGHKATGTIRVIQYYKGDLR